MAIRQFAGVTMGPLGRRMAKFLEAYPRADELWITSGTDGDHGQQSHHYGLSYEGSPTAALDIGADRDPVKMRDFAKWMYENYWKYTVELIHSTPFHDDDGFYVKNQKRFPGGGPYGPPSVIGHFDHIHWATSQDLLAKLERRVAYVAPRVRARTEAPVTAVELRELLKRLRRLQGADQGEFVPRVLADGAVEPAMDVNYYDVGDSSMSHDVYEAAVRYGPPPRDVTGVGITSSVAMDGADLGIMRWDQDRNAIAAMFGDNFEFRFFGGESQSPSIVMYDNNYNVLGIPATNNRIIRGRRRQLWNYQRPNSEYTTILPCDFIKVNGVWYVAAMVTQDLGREKWTVFWQSRDLVNWEKTNPYVSLAHLNGTQPIGHPGNVMLTFDQIGEYVYIFGTGGLARNRGIWMWRNKANEFPHGWWEPWGWDGNRWAWGNANELSPILVGKYGELSFRHLQGQCVLSYFDAEGYRQQARTVKNPEDNWRDGANVVDYAYGGDIPQLYGGYISPLSRLNEPNGMHFFVSQWRTATNDPYKVMLLQDTLWARGDLRYDRAVTRSVRIPEPDTCLTAAAPDSSGVVPEPPDYGYTTVGRQPNSPTSSPAKKRKKKDKSRGAEPSKNGSPVGAYRV